MKRFLPSKDRQRKRWKLEQRAAKFDRAVRKCRHKMGAINDKILTKMTDKRDRQRRLEAWEREIQEGVVDSRPTVAEPGVFYVSAGTSWYPSDSISVTASTTVRSSW